MAWTPSRSQMRDPAELAKQYGITYDAGAIQSKFDEATKAQYDVARKEYQATENKYYSDMYNSQQTALDTIRRSNAEAVSTGASKGMQAANELSSMLGLQQESVAGATQLAVDKNLLTDKEQAAYAKNAVDALNQANQMGLGLGNLNANIFASDTQFDVGQMDYYARLDAAAKQLQGMQAQADASRYAADMNYKGQMAAGAGGGKGGSTGDVELDKMLDKFYDAGSKEAFYAACANNGITEKKTDEFWNRRDEMKNANKPKPDAPPRQDVILPGPNYGTGNRPNWNGTSRPI